MKVLKKEDIMIIPFGTKLYSLLVKMRIYKEELTNIAPKITDKDIQRNIIENEVVYTDVEQKKCSEVNYYEKRRHISHIDKKNDTKKT